MTLHWPTVAVASFVFSAFLIGGYLWGYRDGRKASQVIVSPGTTTFPIVVRPVEQEVKP